MMVLGLYVFMLNRSVSGTAVSTQLATCGKQSGKPTSVHAAGPENDMLTLSGVLMPEITQAAGCRCWQYWSRWQNRESMAPD